MDRILHILEADESIPIVEEINTRSLYCAVTIVTITTDRSTIGSPGGPHKLVHVKCCA